MLGLSLTTIAALVGAVLLFGLVFVVVVVAFVIVARKKPEPPASRIPLDGTPVPQPRRVSALDSLADEVEFIQWQQGRATNFLSTVGDWKAFADWKTNQKATAAPA